MLTNAADGFLFEMHLPNMTKDAATFLSISRIRRKRGPQDHTELAEVSLCERLLIVRSGFTNPTRLSGRLKDVH